MFKIEVTHDIDHLGVKDHYFDLVLPKFFLLCWIGVVKRSLRLKDCLSIQAQTAKSLLLPGYDAWYCLQEWMELEARHGLTSTWFIACRKGKGIAYSVVQARRAVELLQRHGRTIGLHSQMRCEPGLLPLELEEFRAAYGITAPVPLRMHYLAAGTEPPTFAPGLFLYDSSVYDEQRFSGNGDAERPINIMDTFFFSPLMQNRSLESAQAKTRDIFAAAKQQEKTVVIDLHHRSLSACFPRYRQYILWLYEEIGRWQ